MEQQPTDAYCLQIGHRFIRCRGGIFSKELSLAECQATHLATLLNYKLIL